MGFSPNCRGQSVLAAVRRGRNVAVVPPMRAASPTPFHRSWSFNAGAMVPPGLDPVALRGRGTARRGREGQGQDLASTRPRESTAGLSPNCRGQALMAAVRRGQNVAVASPRPATSPTPSHRSWSFNAGAMVPPSLDPVTPRGRGTARRGRGGRGQDFCFCLQFCFRMFFFPPVIYHSLLPYMRSSLGLNPFY